MNFKDMSLKDILKKINAGFVVLNIFYISVIGILYSGLKYLMDLYKANIFIINPDFINGSPELLELALPIVNSFFNDLQFFLALFALGLTFSVLVCFYQLFEKKKEEVK